MYKMWKLCTKSLIIQTCQNKLGFSLYAMLSVCYIVTTSDNWMESEKELSAMSNVFPLNTRDQV